MPISTAAALSLARALMPQVLRLVLPAAAQIVLARVFGPALFGAFTIASSWAGFGALLAIAGMQFTVVKTLPRLPVAAQRAAYGFALRLVLRNALLIVVPASLLVVFIPAEWQLFPRPAIFAGVLLVPAIALAALRPAAVMALGRPWAAQLPENILRPAAFAAVIAALALAGNGPDLTLALLLLLASYALSVAAGHLLVRQLLPRREPAPPGQAETNAAMKQSASQNALATLATSLTRIGDIVIVGALVSLEDLAVYVVLSRILDLFNTFYLVLDPAYEADWSRLIARGDRVGVVHRIASYLSLQVAWAILTAVLFALLGPEILGLFGSHYLAGANLLWLIPAVVMAKALLGPGAQLLVLGDKERLNFRTSLASSLAYFLLVGLLTAAMDTYGALLAMLAYQGLRGTIQAVAVWRSLGIDPTVYSLISNRRWPSP